HRQLASMFGEIHAQHASTRTTKHLPGPGRPGRRSLHCRALLSTTAYVVQSSRGRLPPCTSAAWLATFASDRDPQLLARPAADLGACLAEFSCVFLPPARRAGSTCVAFLNLGVTSLLRLQRNRR